MNIQVQNKIYQVLNNFHRNSEKGKELFMHSQRLFFQGIHIQEMAEGIAAQA